jgi:hypothetical protein
VLVGHESIDRHNRFILPFGYYLQLDEDLLMLRRADSSNVTVFDAVGLDFFDVEFAVWEDAD